MRITGSGTECAEEGCLKTVHCKSLCKKHYHAGYHKSWYEDNKLARNEQQRIYNKKYYAENKDKELSRSKSYKEDHKEFVISRRKAHYAANREVRLAKNKNWYKEHPEYQRAKNSRRRHRVECSMSSQDKKDSVAWRVLIKDNPCFYCGSFSETMHDDHKNPVSLGGTDHWWNLVRSCQPCNQSKFTKTAEEFIKSRRACGAGVYAANYG